METILQGLMELVGVNAAMVVDDQGHLLAHRGRAVYDVQLCEHVSGMLARVVDSIQLQHEDWESISARFADGKVLLRNLGVVPQSGPCVLVIVADATLNASFATVAIRVAANKLKRFGESGSGRTPVPSTPNAPWLSPPSAPPMAWSSSPTAPPTFGPAPSTPLPLPIPSSPSGLRPLGAPTPDPASLAFLTRCAKELARHVGPMAKVFVDEAARRVSPGQPFAVSSSEALLAELVSQIEDPKGRLAFLAALKSPPQPTRR